MDRMHYKISAGVVVRDVVDGPDGRPLTHPESGEPIRVRIEDSDAYLAITDRLLKISDQIARLKGHNAPKRSEVQTTAAPSSERITFANGEEFRDALAQALDAMRPGYTQRVEVVDVVPVETTP